MRPHVIRFAPTWASWLVVIALLGVAYPRVAAGDDESDKRYRPYEKGPLSVEDYLAEQPDDAKRFWAYTETDIRYQFRYTSTSRGNVYTATLSEIDVFAVVLRHKSWNVRLDDESLLDHEQGHFDISQALALEGMIKILKLIRDDHPPTAEGADQQEAAQKLDNRIREILLPIFAEHRAAGGHYDRITNHGRDEQVQAEQRKRQLAALKDARQRLSELPGRN